MMLSRQLAVSFLLLAFWFAEPTNGSNAQTYGTRSEEDAIRAVIAGTPNAFNAHDAKAWIRFCTPDAQLVTVRGESMKGVAEIAKGLAAIFQTRGREAALKTSNVSVRFIRADVALAHVINEMSGVISVDGAKQLPHKELSIRVLVKDQGEWRITAFHNTILQN
jgi:uncharacterized protein (TIGR02246 family)